MRKHFIGYVALPILLAGQCLCATPKHIEPPRWMTTPWTGNSHPYDEVANTIRHAAATGRSPSDIEKEYQQRAQSAPNDPLAQYAWIYALHGQIQTANPDATVPLSDLNSLGRVDPMNVLAFTRERFLDLQETAPTTPFLYVVAERLMNSNPKDDFVKAPAIYALCQDGKTWLAYHYAKKWVDAEPRNPKAQTSLSYVNVGLWMGTRNKKYAQDAIDELTRYLELAPANAGFRRDAMAQRQSLLYQIGKAKSLRLPN